MRAGEQCSTCLFRAPLQSTWRYSETATYECRRYPPIVAVTADEGGQDRCVVRPQVADRDWCGEYQPDPQVFR